MEMMELFKTRRTYRRFQQKAVPQDVITDMIEAARLSSAGSNRQALRLVVIAKPDDVAKMNAMVKWAAFLPHDEGTPKPGEQPVLFFAVLQDTSVSGDLNTDTGIALANMTMAAWAKGVGSCIMGAIDKPGISKMLGIAEPLRLHTVIALGYPSHTARVVPMENENNRYYLDEARNYCVPKRPADELARYF